MKRAREKDELLRFIWVNSGWGSFWGSTHGQVFTTVERGAEIEFGLQPKKMSWGGQKKQRNANLMTLIRHKQDGSEKKEEGSAKVKTGGEERGVVLQSSNWFSECTMEVFSKYYSAIMRGERALIRGRYQKHENGRSFTRGVDCRGWCWQIEMRDDTNWATDLTAIYGDTPSSVQLIQPNWAKMWLVCSPRMTQPTSNNISSSQQFPRIYSHMLRAVWHV